MLRRAGILALLVFQGLWLNVIVPGHTRGVVTLPSWPGGETPHEDHGCCAGGSSKASDDSSRSKPSSDRSAHCAVCFFAVRLSLPPALDLGPGPLELLCGVRPSLQPESLVTPDPLPTYLGRGPPIV